MKLTSSVMELLSGHLEIEQTSKRSLRADGQRREDRTPTIHPVCFHLRLEIDANFSDATTP